MLMPGGTAGMSLGPKGWLAWYSQTSALRWQHEQGGFTVLVHDPSGYALEGPAASIISGIWNGSRAPGVSKPRLGMGSVPMGTAVGWGRVR